MKVSLTLAALLAAVACALPPAAHAATCRPPDYPGSGYFTGLTARHTSCAHARRVTLAHYRCRRHNGVKGRCHRRVLHYRCTEHRGQSIPTEYDARVTCRRGARRVIYTYQQNT